VIAPTRPPGRGARRESRGTTSSFASELAPPRRNGPATYLVLVGLPVALTAVVLAIGTRLPANEAVAPTALPTNAAALRAQLAEFDQSDLSALASVISTVDEAV
jgi:hypothetical protein